MNFGRNTFFFSLGILAVILLAFSFSCHKSTVPIDIHNAWKENHGDSISFIVLGDWGKYGGEAQLPVAEQMDVASRKFNVQFIITTGDNFYPAGVNSMYDVHWQESFEKVYNKAGHQVPWYPTLGNHDYAGNADAEVQYSAISKRWTMPARYYSVRKKVDSTHSVLLVFTDTSPLVGYSSQDTAAQRKWMEKTLSESNDTWKIAVGHHPVYSAGPHSNTAVLIQRFKRIFLQTKTDFYLAGHDHILQYSVLPNESVHYLISGGGSEAYSVKPDANTLFAKASPGFLLMTLYANAANFYFFNHRGDLLYRRQLLK